MQLLSKKKQDKNIIDVMVWLIYILGYTIVFIFVTSLFKSVYIDTGDYYLWVVLTVIIIYILNKTIKPVLVTLTIPITALTFGLFYPCVNLFILKLVDWALGSHFNINNLIIAFFWAILLSINNWGMEKIMKKIIKKVQKNG